MKIMPFIAVVFSAPLYAAINISIEKDLIELGLTASVTDNTYISIGADTDDWIGLGAGYQTFLSPDLRLSAYYEYGLYDDWLMKDIAGIDGVKTQSHQIDLSATQYFDGFSVKGGVTAERIRNGFTWLTVDDANNYSAYIGTAHYFNHLYISGRYEHHFAVDKSDMTDFNQGHANEWELTLGTMKPLWRFYPYAKMTVLDPNGTYYGLSNSEVSWKIGGSFSFK
ncbi:hypothetical protein [Vibrio sonorensis]|uniref:hypothetical protein n=1 Tax=Vibrio sonorensis TaxID=1004316 RepID=UPI000A9812B3|nr:hypothetical protein [Vibrio sonorensis]